MQNPFSWKDVDMCFNYISGVLLILWLSEELHTHLKYCNVILKVHIFIHYAKMGLCYDI